MSEPWVGEDLNEKVAELNALVEREREWKKEGWRREALWQDKIAVLLQDLATLEGALSLIAIPKRPDGTYNLCREACEKIAKDALQCLSYMSSSR